MAWNGRRVMLDAPGRFRSGSADCVVAPQGWTAACRLGRGRVRLVADADLMRDESWAPGRGRTDAGNAAVVGEWLDALAGTARGRRRTPRAGWVAENVDGPVLGVILIAVAAATGLLLRRRRKW